VEKLCEAEKKKARRSHPSACTKPSGRPSSSGPTPISDVRVEKKRRLGKKECNLDRLTTLKGIVLSRLRTGVYRRGDREILKRPGQKTFRSEARERAVRGGRDAAHSASPPTRVEAIEGLDRKGWNRIEKTAVTNPEV